MAARKTAPSYARYLRVPELLDLQKCLSRPAEHDEMLFIIVHQAYELWFRQVLHELDAVIAAMDRDDPREAARLLLRVHEIQRILIGQVAVLETMRPVDFLRFRDHLKPASGFQSYQFRELEFVSGLKEPAYLKAYGSEPELAARLQARLKAPTLGDAFEDLLRRSGFDYPEIPPDGPSRVADVLRRRRLETLRTIHMRRDEHRDIESLAEALIVYDESLSLWRWHHVRMVERMIGLKEGTGGSEGVGYLQTTLGKKCFPDLWELRTVLGPDGEQEA